MIAKLLSANILTDGGIIRELLTNGELDYFFGYESTAHQNGYWFINLPDAINLSSEDYLLMVDNLSRSIIETEVPWVILTAVIGAPFFAYLIVKNKVGWQIRLEVKNAAFSYGGLIVFFLMSAFR